MDRNLALCSVLGFWVVMSDTALAEWRPLDTIPPVPTHRYTDLWFIDQDTGWVISSRGRIYRTTNGGDSWEFQHEGPDNPPGRSITFASPTRGWAGWLGSQYLLETSDGGSSWTRVLDLPPGSPPGFCGMYAVDSQVMYAVGTFYGPAGVLKTTDAGVSWTGIDMSPYAGTLIDCYFTSPERGFVVGGVGTYPDSTFARILETTDGGESWIVRHTTTDLDEWCWKISFPSPLVGYVSVQHGRGPEEMNKVLKTTDGGASWIEKDTTDWGQQGIGFRTDQVGWVGGGGPTFLTTDGGDSWVQDSFTALSEDRVNRIRFLGPDLGYACGAYVFKYVADFTLSLPTRVASVPAGNGTAEFQGSISNVSTTVADILDLNIGNFGSWPAEFQIEGDPNFYTSHSLALGPGESKDISIFVHTDAVPAIASGEIVVESDNTGRVQPAAMRVWNGSHSILFVDDDNNQNYEVPYEAALTSNGYLFEDWNVSGGHADQAPKLSDMLDFDAVVWHTAYFSSAVLSADDIAALQGYLDDGGALFLSSMDFLTGLTNPHPFVNNCLGVASWVNNTKANTATGVAGDPITDGMVLPLSWPAGIANRADNLTPGTGANAILTSEIGPGNPAAVRFEMANGSRTVFCTIPQNVMSNSDPDPNNSETVIEKTMLWLLNQSTTAVGDGTFAGASRVMNAFPNPFGPSTELRFAVSARAASQPVTLQIVDPSGRLVRQLANGQMSEGVHNLVWDGSDDGGRVTPAGLYFAKLHSEDGESGFKIVRMR